MAVADPPGEATKASSHAFGFFEDPGFLLPMSPFRTRWWRAAFAHRVFVAQLLTMVLKYVRDWVELVNGKRWSL